jgi:hypothetical protein
MVQSGDEYREKNRIRLQRYYERQTAAGKKRVSALISDKAYTLLENEKNQTGVSISQLIEQAVVKAFQKPEPKPPAKPVLDSTLKDLIPDCTNRKLTLEERDRILVTVGEALPGMAHKTVRARVDLLNEKGVPVVLRKGPHAVKWDRTKFSNNLLLAKERLGIE